MALLRYVLAVACVGVAGCSIAYDWDADGQPCRVEGAGTQTVYACDEGFSCFRKDGQTTTSCVRDGSRRRGDECNEDEQCNPGLHAQVARAASSAARRIICRRQAGAVATSSASRTRARLSVIAH